MRKKGKVYEEGTGTCKHCGTLISRYSKSCRPCADNRRKEYSKSTKIKVPEWALVRGEISYSTGINTTSNGG